MKRSTAHLVSTLKLAQGAFGDLRRGWKNYLWILAIITVPRSFLTLDPNSSSNPTLSAYGLVALLIMNGALLWAALRQEKTGRVPGPAEAYYGGSAVMVRLLVVSLLLVIMMLPLIAGSIIYLIGTSAPTTTVAEQLLIGLVALLVSLPSLVWAVRFGLAPLVVVDTDLRPIAALRRARALTLGRFWRLTLRYLGLIGFSIVMTLPIAAVAAGLALLRFGSFAYFLFGLLTAFIVLPLYNLYLLRLYRSLEAPAPEPAS